MITKAVITYDDNSEVTFNYVPAVPEVVAVGVDLSTIPTSPVKVEDTTTETNG